MRASGASGPGGPGSLARAVAAAAAVGCLAAAVVGLWVTADGPPRAGRLLFGLWRVRHAVGALAAGWLALTFASAAVSRNALFAWWLTTLLAVAAWALLEVPGLLGQIDYPRLLSGSPTEALGESPRPHLDVSGTALQDLASGWGVPSEPIPFRYRTDRRGFRNEIDRARADVVLLGDSFLVAGLIPWEETLTARLERALGRSTLAVALIGIGPQREAELLRGAGLPLRDALVLHFVFEGNDLADSARFRSGAAAKRDASLLERTLLHQLALRVQRWTQPAAGEAASRSCRIGSRSYLFLWRGEHSLPYRDEIDPMLTSLAALRAEVESAGGRYAVVALPSKLRVLGPLCEWPRDSDLADWPRELSPLRDALRGWAEASGTPLLDLTPALESAARAGAVPWFWGDTHWNAEGHAAAAEALLAWPVVREGAGPQRRGDASRAR